MLVNITDFANERNLERDTINAYIRKHPDIQQYVCKDGKNTAIDNDSEGYELLCKKYPLPKIVQVIPDTESRERLLEAQNRIITLQGNILSMQNQLIDLKASQSLLEDRTNQLQDQKAINSNLQDQLADHMRKNVVLNDELESCKEENIKLQKLFEEEKCKSWWQKLLSK